MTHTLLKFEKKTNLFCFIRIHTCYLGSLLLSKDQLFIYVVGTLKCSLTSIRFYLKITYHFCWYFLDYTFRGLLAIHVCLHFSSHKVLRQTSFLLFKEENQYTSTWSYKQKLQMFAILWSICPPWYVVNWGFTDGTSGKESAFTKHKRCGFNPWVGRILWSSKWQPTPVFLPGKPHGQRSLAGYSLWVCKESDMAEHTYS